jgi:hypothetical protein
MTIPQAAIPMQYRMKVTLSRMLTALMPSVRAWGHWRAVVFMPSLPSLSSESMVAWRSIWSGFVVRL